eukprot:scaffold6.g2909.t1
MGASVGTLMALGGATLAVSTLGLSVVKVVVKQRKMKAATECTVCKGTGYLKCGLCRGRAILHCRAPVKLSQLRRRKAAGADSGAANVAQCACPACGTTLEQRCLNCLGEGKVCLPA